MNRKLKLGLAGGVGAVGLAAMVLVPGQLALSADHFDPPLRTDPRPGFDPTPDRLADIADVFAFYDATNVYLSLTVHTRDATSTSPLSDIYDRDVLYALNVSTDTNPATTEVPIRFRFGPATNGTGFGVRYENLPGLSGNLDCRVEQLDCQSGGVRAYAGLRNDPFFFDLQGFRETTAMGTLRFNPNRDFFGGKNILTVVLQIPRASLNTNQISVWGASSRLGGQL